MICARPIDACVRPYSHLAPNYDATVGIPFFLRLRDAFEKLIQRYLITFRTAADIGCGTGLFARYLNREWAVPVIAVDKSREMLRIAARNCRGLQVCLLRQDIRCLKLPRRVDLITCNFDTLNHLVSDRDLVRTFRAVHENLNPGGHFIFDMVTQCGPLGPARIYTRRFYSRRRIVMQRVRWEPLRRLLSIIVSIRSRGKPVPVVEVHRERTYSLAEIGRALHEARFVVRGLHDAATLIMPAKCPPRIIVVAKKKDLLK